MDLVDLRSAFAGRLLDDAAAMAPFLTDWRRRWTGHALAVAQPDNAAGVAAVLRWCRAHGVSVVPQGGNTGLSGGATPAAGGRSLVLSTARLQRIRDIDAVGQTLTAGGSISAEHGLGVLRRDEAARYKSAVELRLMQSIKQALDPMNLMNPGKLLGLSPFALNLTPSTP